MDPTQTLAQSPGPERRLAQWIRSVYYRESVAVQRSRQLRGYDFDARCLACTFLPFVASCRASACFSDSFSGL